MNDFTIRPFVAGILVVLVLGGSASANAPSGRYTVSGGTVYDTKTKLTWQQSVPTTTYTLADAKTQCASATVSAALGGTGWRLPTAKELLTIVDYTQASAPFIDPAAFPGAPASYFWSCSPSASSSSLAWAVDFSGGSTYVAGADSTADVRCVR